MAIVAEIGPSSEANQGKGLLHAYITEQLDKNGLIKATKRMNITNREEKSSYDIEKIKEIYQDTRSDR